MNSDHTVRCKTRRDLRGFAYVIFVLNSLVLLMVFDAVKESRAGSPPSEWSLNEAGLVFVAVLFAVEVVLLAWVVAFLVREWLVLGEATLLFSPKKERISILAPRGEISPRR